MSDNPIQRLIAAGHTEILEAAGWRKYESGWHYWTYDDADFVLPKWASESKAIIDRAGMAALEWLCKSKQMRHEPIYSPDSQTYCVHLELCFVRQDIYFTAPTLAEAAIDAAIAVWEASK
jgi:hypothetical protein